MRFLRLTSQELEQMEKEFINFLASSGITASDWQHISSNEPDKTNELVDLFSDLVYEKVFSNICYLDHRSKNSLKVFHCMDESIKVIAIELDDNPAHDFTDEESFSDFFKNPPEIGVKMFSAEKEYNKNREEEIFQMMQQGCCSVSKEYFESIAQLLNSNK